MLRVQLVAALLEHLPPSLHLVILTRGIGQAFVAKDVDFAEVEAFLDDELAA